MPYRRLLEDEDDELEELEDDELEELEDDEDDVNWTAWLEDDDNDEE